jgi:hypothetical protein
MVRGHSDSDQNLLKAFSCDMIWIKRTAFKMRWVLSSQTFIAKNQKKRALKAHEHFWDTLNVRLWRHSNFSRSKRLVGLLSIGNRVQHNWDFKGLNCMQSFVCSAPLRGNRMELNIRQIAYNWDFYKPRNGRCSYRVLLCWPDVSRILATEELDAVWAGPWMLASENSEVWTWTRLRFENVFPRKPGNAIEFPTIRLSWRVQSWTVTDGSWNRFTRESDVRPEVFSPIEIGWCKPMTFPTRQPFGSKTSSSMTGGYPEWFQLPEAQTNFSNTAGWCWSTM